MPAGIKANSLTSPTNGSQGEPLSPSKGGPRKPGPFGPSEPLYKLPQISLARQDSLDDMREAEDFVKRESMNKDQKVMKLQQEKEKQMKAIEEQRIAKEKDREKGDKSGSTAAMSKDHRVAAGSGTKKGESGEAVGTRVGR